MRSHSTLLIAGIACLMATAASARGEPDLRLDLRPNTQVWHPGDRMELRVEIHNDSPDPVAIYPEFQPSRDWLAIKFLDCRGNVLPSPEFTVDRADLTPSDFITLHSGHYHGRTLVFSPAPADFFVGGLVEGELTVTATMTVMKLSSGNEAVAQTLRSRGTTLCVGTPSREGTARQRANLQSNDAERVMEALAYFELVRDRTASHQILRMLGEPRGWCSRFQFDAFAALRALRNQRRPENRTYLEDCLDGRHSATARQAISELAVPEKRRCDACEPTEPRG